MNAETHERARRLITAAQVEGIGGEQRDWLDRHLASCTDCVNQANELDAAIQAVRGLRVAATPELVRETMLAVRRRAQQMHTRRNPNGIPLGIATGIATVWMVMTVPYIWRGFAWLGRVAHIPDPVWQLGFMIWWFLPATVLAAAAAWHHSTKHDSRSEIDLNWGLQ